jgi:acyl transferase domain-containing protein/acyl carrier protein
MREGLPREPLAIVGIGCRFPGGVCDAGSLWRLLCEGVDAVGEVPPERWDLRRVYHPEPAVPGKTYARHGGFLAQPPHEIDAAFFGLSAREAAILDPQQRLLLEATWEAFEDAGHDVLALRRRRVGVFVGGFSLDNLIERLGAASRDHISPSTAASSTMVMLSNRLSHAFDFTGPSLSVDTACSSSLVATHLACRSLWDGESEVAIAAGVNALLIPEPFVAMAKGGFLSRRGRCSAFDASADGYVRAEGVGVVVVRPLAAARAAGDRVYACIVATGVNQDGRTPGVATPSFESQRALIRQVLGEAGIGGGEVAYVEAHGTGTQAGDPVEAASIGAEIASGREAAEALWVGSIKTNIGHTEAAAGVAGLIKAALVLHHRAVPPNLHFETPNPKIDLAGLGLRVPVEKRLLPTSGPLHAAVNSFGYGGTNAHAVLRTAPPADAAPAEPSTAPAGRFFPLSARDEPALRAFAASVADRLEHASLHDIGHSLARRRAHHAVRGALWARSAPELAADLRALDTARAEGRACVGRAPDRPRQLLFVYTGMGAQYVGMGRTLFAEEPAFREAVERCDAIARASFGQTVVEYFADGAPGGSLGAPIADPFHAQLPNLVLQVALTELWRSLGIEPAGVIGHSVGEVGAAWAAGALSLGEALRITHHRGVAFRRLAGRGSMMAVGLGRDAATAHLDGRGDDAAISTILAPDLVVVGGSPATLARLAAELDAAGVFHRRLHVDVAYHHQQVEAIDDELKARFGTVAGDAPRLPLYSTFLGARVGADPLDADHWRRGVRSPADFEAAIIAALEAGFDAALEIGPNRVMGAAVATCAASRSVATWTAASMVRGEDEREHLRRALAELYVNGVPVRWEALYPTGRFERLPAYPWQRTRLWAAAPAARASRFMGTEDPLLHERVPGPTPTWQTELSSTLFPYLRDHVVAGAPLFPGAGYVAVALAASRALDRGNSLEALRLERPLQLEESTWMRVEADGASGRFVVSARGTPDAEWQRHAIGRLGLRRGQRRRRFDLDAARRSCPSNVDAVQLYAELEKRGLSYGPSFRTVQELWRGQGSLVARLALPDGVPLDGPLHAALLDGAFQALAGVAAEMEGRDPFVPVFIEDVRLHGDVGPVAWVAASVSDRAPSGFSASLCLCAAGGEVIAEIEGARFRRLPTVKPDRLERRTLQETWEKGDAPQLERTAARRWLLVGGDECFATLLASELRSRGQACAWAPDGADLTGGNGPRPDAVAWIAPRSGPADGGLGTTARLVRFVQHVLRWPEPRPTLAVITRGAYGRSACPAQAAAWCLGRVVATEHPDLGVLLVDCEDDERVPVWLARELLGATREREVRFGAAGRLVARLRPWSAPEPEPETVEVEDVPVALQQARAGELDSLGWREVPRRAPGPGEVELRSVAAALNFKDVLKAMGLLPAAYLEQTYFGDQLGMETSGVVVRVGEGVTGVAPGDEVVAAAASFASYLTVPFAFTRQLPRHLSLLDAPVFINYITAHYALVDTARLQPGERVLIHLASGGVGQAAIAIARMLGARVLATAGSEEKRAHLASQGIEHVFDSRSLEFADRVLDLTGGVGVDVVLNSLPGEGLRRSWELLAPYGRFVELGKRDIEEGADLPMLRFDENRTFAAIDVDRMMRERPRLFQRIGDDVWRLLDEGWIGPLPTAVFPAPQVVEAFRTMSRAGHVGKVVIDYRGQSVRARRTPAALFRDDRAYLVTGAFGGFGQALARWMAAEGARHLALVGRRGATTGEGSRLVDGLRAMGASVDARAVDVCDEAAVRELLHDLRRTGRPIAGVFHAAMVLDDALVLSIDDRRLDAVMRPKALGAWHLHRCTIDDPIEHFVLFSSIAAVVGNEGQGAYCAANGYLAGLARRRQAEGRPAVSIGWGVLSDAGAASRTDGLVARLEGLGIRAFTTTEALAELGRLMRAAPEDVVCADVDWDRWASRSGAASNPKWRPLVRAATDRDALAALRRSLSSLTAPERLDAVQRSLRATLGKVLGMPDDSIPVDRSLGNLGVDSLMAVELSSGLERDLGVKLPTSVLMQGPTVASLAARVLEVALAGEPVR